MTPSLWSNADLRRLWLSEAVSVFGSWFTTVAVMTVVYTRFHSSVMVALVGVAMTLPSLLLNGVVGRRVRRANARRVMLGADAARGLLVLGLAFAGGSAFACIAVVGACAVFSLMFRVARAVCLPALVAGPALVQANSGFGVIWGLACALGGSLGGVVVSLYGAPTAFCIDAASFALSLALLWRLRPLADAAPPAPAAEAAAPDSVWSAVRFAWGHEGIRTVILAGISWGLVGGSLSVLVPLHGDHFAPGGSGIGLFYGVQASGFLLGSLGVGLAGRLAPQPMMRAFVVAYVLQAVGFCLFVGGIAPLVGVAGLFLTRFFGGVIGPLDSTLLQTLTPERWLSRVSSLHFAVFGSVMQMSVALTGLLADLFTAQRVGLAIAAWGLASAGFVLLRLRGSSPALRAQSG